MENEVKVLSGGIAVDDRGSLSFCNDFDMKDVRRFYMVENFNNHFIRAWHGHKEEGKYVTVLSGSAIIGLVDLRKFDDWNYYQELIESVEPTLIEGKEMTGKQDDEMQDFFDAQQYRYVISAKKPTVIWIPPGFVNGAMNLQDDTRVVYFSTKGLGESEGDDYRFPLDYWDEMWKVEMR